MADAKPWTDDEEDEMRGMRHGPAVAMMRSAFATLDAARDLHRADSAIWEQQLNAERAKLVEVENARDTALSQARYTLKVLENFTADHVRMRDALQDISEMMRPANRQQFVSRGPMAFVGVWNKVQSALSGVDAVPTRAELEELAEANRHHDEHHEREKNWKPPCVACESQPHDLGPGCPCARAPCVHDFNRYAKENGELQQKLAATSDRAALAERALRWMVEEDRGTLHLANLSDGKFDEALGMHEVERAAIVREANALKEGKTDG